jgi:ubiquinol-cytochrome c reductase subunit 7
MKISKRLEDDRETDKETVLGCASIAPKAPVDQARRGMWTCAAPAVPTIVPGLTTSPQDYPYLSPIISEIEKEVGEREDLESMQITKPTPRK